MGAVPRLVRRASRAVLLCDSVEEAGLVGGPNGEREAAQHHHLSLKSRPKLEQEGPNTEFVLLAVVAFGDSVSRIKCCGIRLAMPGLRDDVQ